MNEKNEPRKFEFHVEICLNFSLRNTEGWREIFFYNVVQALVNVPHLLKFSIMLLSL